MQRRRSEEQTGFGREKKLAGGIPENILAWAAPGLIPKGAGHLDGLTPAILEAIPRYTKSPAAMFFEFGFCPAGTIGRGTHLLQQVLIASAFLRVLGERPYDSAVFRQIRRVKFGRTRFQVERSKGS